jgi:2-polyprenyl-6-methoxyphenol hydroxylase-like FAD-dependent oxidoreductase
MQSGITKNMTSFDTVVVGGGPIGMAIVSCLGQHGMAVALIEKNPEPPVHQ